MQLAKSSGEGRAIHIPATPVGRNPARYEEHAICLSLPPANDRSPARCTVRRVERDSGIPNSRPPSGLCVSSQNALAATPP
eukprot:873825-Amphidinium_carterae.1